MFTLSTKTILGAALAGVQSWCVEGLEAGQGMHGLTVCLSTPRGLRHENPSSIRNFTCDSSELGTD